MSHGIFQVFTGLPTCLSCTVLGRWLDLKSICRLDSALCERSKRVAFLKLLQSIECIGKFVCWHNEQLAWTIKRSIRTSKLSLNENFPHDVLEEYLLRFGNHVRTLLVDSRTKENFVARYCQNIVSYHSSLCGDIHQVLEVFNTNPNLMELSVTCFSDILMQQERIFLPRLRYLCIFGGGFDDTSCMALIRSSKQLVFLSLFQTKLTSSGMLEAAQYCPQIRYFQPPAIFEIDNALVKMTQVCMNIQHLDLSNCINLTDAGIIAVAKNVKCLRTIHFKYSHLITNACLHHLAEHQCNTLEEFSLFDVFETSYIEPTTPENQETFNAATVSLFKQKCRKLHVFDWKRLIYWKPASFATWAVPHVLTADRVTTLTLYNVNNAILTAVAATCKQLVVLFFACNSADDIGSDDALIRVVTSCPALRRLHVDTPQIARLQQLFTSFSHIRVLSHAESEHSYSLQSQYERDHKGSEYA